MGDLAIEVPSLANGGISSDGRTYTYRLRRYVMWHDGLPFTARDVVASWRAAMNPNNNILGREGYDQIATIQAAGPHTVIVHLRKRYPPFVSLFFAALQDSAKPVLPAHLLGRDGEFGGSGLDARPIGTGPFRFVSWARGEEIILTRFDRYFKGRPRLARIEWHLIPSAQTVVVALQNHEIDMPSVPQWALLNQYRSIGGVVIQTFRVNGQQSLIINTGKPGLSDVAVRRALAVAVPYPLLLRNVTHNFQRQARNVLPTTALGYEPLPLRKYDPAAADNILDQAGWRRGGDGVRVRRGVRLAFTLVTISGFTSLERVALLVQSAMKPVGIEIAIKLYPEAVLVAPDGPVYGGSFDLSYNGRALNWDPDLYDFLACDRWYPRGQNVYRFCDPKLDALERAGLQTDDSVRRAAIYRKAGRIIWSEVPYVPVYGGRTFTAHSVDLQNYSISAGGWWNAWQWDI